MTKERKIVYGVLGGIVYLTMYLYQQRLYRVNARNSIQPPKIVTFRMPESGMRWAVLSNGGGVFQFEPDQLVVTRYGILKWQVDGPSQLQVLYRKTRFGYVSELYDRNGKPIKS